MEFPNEIINLETAIEKDGDSVKRPWHVNKEMLLFKAHFLLFVGGMAAILPYQAVLGITKLGLTASNLAAIYTVQQFILIFTHPGICYLADYFNRLKPIIAWLTVLQAVFCFLMIIIPSAGMPKYYVSQSNVSQVYYHKCDLCTHFKQLKNVSSNEALVEDILSQVLDCYKYSEKFESKHVVEHCPNEILDTFQNISYRMFKATCEHSHTECYSSTNCTIPYRINRTNALFISQFVDSLQNSMVVCLPSEEKTFYQGNITSIMKQHCHAVLKPASIGLEELLLAKSFETDNCLNDKSNVAASVELGHDAYLSTANFKTYQFWLFSVCLIVSCAFINSIFTISDTACYESMQGSNYGRQRVWGSLSWGLIAPLAGFLNDYTEGYMASWCLMVLLCILQLWNMSKMNLMKPKFSQNILKDIKKVFSSLEFLAFEAGVLMNGMFTGIIYFYLPWFLTTIGGNKLSIGLAYTAQCFLGEVPLMYVSSWMIKKFGHFNLVSLALISHGIRFFLYSYLYNPWWILPIESLHGFTYGTFYSAMTSYGKLNTKPGIEATTQSILYTTYDALGAGLGCVLSGICFDRFGGHNTFFYASFLCIASTLLNVGSTVAIAWRKSGLDNNKTLNACNRHIATDLEFKANEQQLFIQQL